MPYELTDADRREVDRQAAIGRAVRERQSQIEAEQRADSAKADEAAKHKHGLTEATRFSLEPVPGSVEFYALQHARQQAKDAESAGPLFRHLLPEFVKNVQPRPKPITAPGTPAKTDQPAGPTPGSVEDVAARWRAARSDFGGSSLVKR